MSKKLSAPEICEYCKKENIWFTGKICQNCYRKHFWERKKKICPRCQRLLPIKGKGLCGGCYNTVYRLEYQKAMNQIKIHRIGYNTYKRITEKCVICGFDKFVTLHHLDQNKKNNSQDNLIGLCPNHHQMLHTLKYKDKIFQLLKDKGFNPQEKKLKEIK
ncbi:hypothetical protein J4405_01710 [Candidatus Woesearchaeota archaeon]|nr:hypothetical protein [Candidatus Woesearchaeota archaeon]